MDPNAEARNEDDFDLQGQEDHAVPPNADEDLSDDGNAWEEEGDGPPLDQGPAEPPQQPDDAASPPLVFGCLCQHSGENIYAVRLIDSEPSKPICFVALEPIPTHASRYILRVVTYRHGDWRLGRFCEERTSLIFRAEDRLGGIAEPAWRYRVEASPNKSPDGHPMHRVYSPSGKFIGDFVLVKPTRQAVEDYLPGAVFEQLVDFRNAPSFEDALDFYRSWSDSFNESVSRLPRHHVIVGNSDYVDGGEGDDLVWRLLTFEESILPHLQDLTEADPNTAYYFLKFMEHVWRIVGTEATNLEESVRKVLCLPTESDDEELDAMVHKLVKMSASRWSLDIHSRLNLMEHIGPLERHLAELGPDALSDFLKATEPMTALFAILPFTHRDVRPVFEYKEPLKASSVSSEQVVDGDPKRRRVMAYAILPRFVDANDIVIRPQRYILRRQVQLNADVQAMCSPAANKNASAAAAGGQLSGVVSEI